MVTNQQVRILMKAIETEKTLELAAAKAGMDQKTARRDGSALYAPGRALRTRQRDAHQQPALFQMGAHLQRSHDHCGRHRSLGPPQHHCGTQHPKLPRPSGKDAGEKVSMKNQKNAVLLMCGPHGGHPGRKSRSPGQWTVSMAYPTPRANGRNNFRR